MSQKQSPAYPNFPLEKAIVLAGQIFEKDRKNPIDRSVAATHIGYGGISGASDKSLATLAHYGLVERAGKGQLQVTRVLVDILFPDSEDDKRNALREAGLAPTVFQMISERFSDGPPSEDALKAWLVRENFLDRAINPVARSYLETVRFLKQSEAFETVGSPDENREESSGNTAESGSEVMQAHVQPTAPAPQPRVATELNRIDAEIKGDTVLVKALLDKEGLKKLAKKIEALSIFMDD